MMERQKKKRIAILGFGHEGKSLKKFLSRYTAYRKAVIEVRDKTQGENYLNGLTEFDALFRSPGVPYLTPEIQEAKKKGVATSSATNLFFEIINQNRQHTSRKRPIIIGVTGTKGKGTTCTLIAHILRTAGKKVMLAGNIGKPMLDVLPAAKKADFIVLELSSFQLQDLNASPDIAVVLDIFPDHLDVHKNLKEYFEAKSHVARYQSSKGKVFYFADNPLSKRIASSGKGKKVSVKPTENSLKKNIQMAISVARSMNISASAIQRATQTFKGLEHRLEFIREYRGVHFYNDSAATNPEATSAALRTFRSPLILIAGGKDKKLDYESLGATVRASHQYLKMVILFGENREKIRDAIMHELRSTKAEEMAGAPYLLVTETLSEALRSAYQFAQSAIESRSWQNAVILFSPASASFDQFRNYAERGKKFKALAKKIR